MTPNASPTAKTLSPTTTLHSAPTLSQVMARMTPTNGAGAASSHVTRSTRSGTFAARVSLCRSRRSARVVCSDSASAGLTAPPGSRAAGDDGAMEQRAKLKQALFHPVERLRRAVGGGSEFASGRGAENASEMPPDYVAIAEATGQSDEPRVQELAGRALVHREVKEQLIQHVSTSIATGALPPNAGTLIRLFHADTTELEVDTALAIAGTAGVIDETGDGGVFDVGVRYLSRQTGSLGGGSSEMARNVIAERILGFPRELAADRGVPFNQVKRGRQ